MESFERYYMDAIDNIFQSLDEIVARSLGDSNAESILTDAYFGFWQAIKRKVGTSSQFTGIAEYLFFRYIMRYIERELPTKLQPHQETPYTFSFRSRNILMTHDIDISKFRLEEVQKTDVSVHTGRLTYRPPPKKQRTDIAVFAQTSHALRLLAAFELKIFISTRAALEGDLERLQSLSETGVLLFEILLSEPTAAEKRRLVEFCHSPGLVGRAFVISKHDMGCNIVLNEALDRIIGLMPV